MNSLMIHILDEKIPYAQLKDQLDITQPLTKEQVVDLIISKLNESDDSNFKAFKQKYESLAFKHNSTEKKHETYIKDLAALEENYQNTGTWNDPGELKADLLNAEFSYYKEHDKAILYNRQIEDWRNTAAGWMVVSKKKEYLTLALEILMSLVKGTTATSSQKIGETPIGLPQQSGVGQVEASDKKETKKKVAEKWYALLHMIYVNMRRIEMFEKLSDKKGIIEYGKDNYPFKGTGQMFYKYIHIIHKYRIHDYIYNRLKKDRKLWKKIITEISGNDPKVKEWIDINK
jgi:hypothetical protein